MLKLKDCFHENKECDGFKTTHEGWHRANVSVKIGDKKNYYCLDCFLRYVFDLNEEYNDTIKQLWEYQDQEDMSRYR